MRRKEREREKKRGAMPQILSSWCNFNLCAMFFRGKTKETRDALQVKLTKDILVLR